MGVILWYLTRAFKKRSILDKKYQEEFLAYQD